MNYPKDFTLRTFADLLSALKNQAYQFQTFSEFLKNPRDKVALLRHDIDLQKQQAVVFAELEAERNLNATYYFRVVKSIFDPVIIKGVAALGHEVGYHYEDLSLAKGNFDTAIQFFDKHLRMFRQYCPVETICMHGSPMSKWDNRSLWQRYDYRDYGIIGEPYFDIDFSSVFYLTDTGRRWDGEKVSLRDKVTTQNRRGGNHFSHLNFHSTKDFINAVEQQKLPDRIMITTHPQRWHNRPILWAKELLWQNVKNVGKYLLIQKNG